MKNKIVLDTSSLISLNIIKLLSKCLHIFEVVVPRAVVRELEETSKYKDLIGTSSKQILKLVKRSKITTYAVKDKTKAITLLSSDVSLGEAECAVCCIENRISLLIIDDVDAMYRLEDIAVAEGIETNISIWLIAELVKNKIITKKDAIKAIKNLVRIREWEGGVLEVLAKKYLENI